MDRLTAIRVFAAVADAGSLTAVADQLDMSRAMVSRYLAELERWLGVRVLHRTTRRVTLTAAGELALLQCRQMLALGEQLQEQLLDEDSALRGQIRLTCSVSFGRSHLAAAVTAFVGTHPQVRIELLLQDRAVNLVEERVDLAIRITRRMEDGLIARRLAPCRSRLCASPAYLQQHGSPRTPAELARHQCLTHAYADRHQWTLWRDNEASAVAVSGNLSANDALVLEEMVLQGAGIAMLPTYLVAPRLDSGALVAVLPDYEPEPMAIYAVYLSRRQMPRVVRMFIEHLAQRLGDPPCWDTV